MESRRLGLSPPHQRGSPSCAGPWRGCGPGSTGQSAGQEQDSWSEERGACSACGEHWSCWVPQLSPSVRVSVCQPLFLIGLLPGEETQAALPPSACTQETGRRLRLTHLYCNDVYNLVVFHYLIFKKPILLVFYMKKNTAEVKAVLYFSSDALCSVVSTETLHSVLHAGSRVRTGYFCISGTLGLGLMSVWRPVLRPGRRGACV